jgi:hypothetical protein
MKKVLQYQRVGTDSEWFWQMFEPPMTFDGPAIVREKVIPERGDVYLSPNESMTYVVTAEPLDVNDGWKVGKKAGKQINYVPVRTHPSGDPDEYFPQYVDLERFDSFKLHVPEG